MSIGRRIQNLRKKQNMTQEELAEHLDVTRQVISKWERDLSVPSTEIVIQLSKIFGVTTDYLLEGHFEDVSSKTDELCIRPQKLSKWMAFAFSVVAFLLAIRYIVEMCNADECSAISTAPGITVATIVVLSLLLKMAMLVRKQWSCKIREFIISYLTFLFGISAGIWSIYLIWFTLIEVFGYPAWAVFIILVVLRYVAIITAIVFGVVIGVRLILKKRKR